MRKPHIQRIQSYSLCQPTLTYSKLEIRLKVNATSDILVDAIVWSVNSTDTGFRNEKSEGTESNLMYLADNDQVFMT